MNRREVIKSVAMLLGGTFSAPTLMAMKQWEQGTPPSSASSMAFSLTDSQRNIVAEIAEIIIPKTDTVGAKEVGVPAFIEMMLNDCYTQPEHISFMKGVAAMEKVNFLALSDGERRGVLKLLEQDTHDMMAARQTRNGNANERALKGLPFWRLMKELTLLGYYTSEDGIKASFDYVQIPGKLELIKLKPHQKSYAY